MRCFSPLLILWLAASASGATFTLNPTEDAFVSSANPTSSFGAAGQISVAAPGLAKGEFQSLLKFNLAAAKASFDTAFGAGLWAIDAVTLKLTNTAPNNALFNGNGAGPGGTNVNFSGQFTLRWMANDSWVQGDGTPAAFGTTGVTFSTLPTYLGGSDETLGTYAYTAATTGSNTWTTALTSGFLADATAGNVVSLLAKAADTSVSFSANALEFGTVANRPLLTISASAVPEPATSGLLLATGLVLAGRRRRRDGRAG